MKILWSIHLYPPRHNCGSEWMAHQINKFLISRGHSVKVLLHDARKNNIRTPYTFDGVDVFGGPVEDEVYRQADVIFTHLDYTQFSIAQARSVNRLLVHFVHNDIPYGSIMNADRDQAIVYNSKWLQESQSYPFPSIVVNPPCDYDHYNVCENPEENEFITLISLNKNKGGELFYRIAEAMPEKKFLGIIGSYDQQIIRPMTNGNITILPNTPDILGVYRKTRILLMPSAYESWGRTATEAMCSGIPVICTPTPGLKENCGNAAIYVPKRDFSHGREINDGTSYNIKPIIKAIKRLNDKKYYLSVSQTSRQRAKGHKSQMEEFETFLFAVLNERRRKPIFIN